MNKVILGFYNESPEPVEISFKLGKKKFNYNILPNEFKKQFIPMFHHPVVKNVKIVYSVPDLETKRELLRGCYYHLNDNEIIWFSGPFTGIIVPKAKRDYLPEFIEKVNSDFLKDFKNVH
jgi:hypothetical protein